MDDRKLASIKSIQVNLRSSNPEALTQSKRLLFTQSWYSWKLILSGLLLCVSTVSTFANPPDWVVKEEFLSPDISNFDCHSSTLVETAPGSLCAVWKGGPGEGLSNINLKADVGLWSSLFNGTNWSEPIEIVSIPQSVCWNPVLCKLLSGQLLLFYYVGPDPRHSVSFMKRSQDGGVTWGAEEILPAGIRGPTKNKPVVLDGTLICPSSMAVGEPSDFFKATACWIEISEDGGLHWKKIGPLELSHRKFGVIEPALFFDANGSLKMYCRDRAHKVKEIGYIWEATSCDQGLHWSELKQTLFPNPDAGFDIADLGEGKVALIYNHSHTDRFPLNVAFSLDGGDHWSSPLILDQVGEFPAAIATSDGRIHTSYAVPTKAGQRRIKHIVIDPEVLFQNGR